MKNQVPKVSLSSDRVPLAFLQRQGWGKEPTPRNPRPGSALASAGRGGQAASSSWRSLGFSHQHNGLWDPDTFYQPWGTGGLVWIYLSFFFFPPPFGKEGGFFPSPLFLFFIFFLNGIGCFAGIALLPASV